MLLRRPCRQCPPAPQILTVTFWYGNESALTCDSDSTVQSHEKNTAGSGESREHLTLPLPRVRLRSQRPLWPLPWTRRPPCPATSCSSPDPAHTTPSHCRHPLSTSAPRTLKFLILWLRTLRCNHSFAVTPGQKRVCALGVFDTASAINRLSSTRARSSTLSLARVKNTSE